MIIFTQTHTHIELPWIAGSPGPLRQIFDVGLGRWICLGTCEDLGADIR